MDKTLYVISGVTGMTGNELARQIVARGQHVLGFDNFFASSLDTVADIIDNPRFTFLEYDLINKEQMADLADRVRRLKPQFDKIVYINCAAVVHTEHFYEVHSTFDVNVVGMRDFLEQAISVGAEQYINCSTSEIYSMQSVAADGSGVKESDYVLLATAEHSQRTSYAAGKLLTEFFMKDAVDKGRILGCSIRFANVYSKDEKLAKHIIPHVLTSLWETGQVQLLENARVTRRTFLHNIDSCASVLALSDHPEALDGTVYNVATDEEVSILELVEMAARKLGLPTPPVITYKGYRSADPPRRLLDTEKLRKATGWAPKVSLSQGLDMCIEHLKQTRGSGPR